LFVNLASFVPLVSVIDVVVVVVVVAVVVGVVVVIEKRVFVWESKLTKERLRNDSPFFRHSHSPQISFCFNFSFFFD
jgi:hypothetical protein